MTVREIIYAILDLAKLSGSDDSFITEEHVLFLCKKYRSFLLKKEQEKRNGAEEQADEFETQQICLTLERVNAIDGSPCLGGFYLRTVEAIPNLLGEYQPNVYPVDFYQESNISFVSRDKMKSSGNNKWLKNIIYASLGPDKHIYLTSSNPQFKYLKKLRLNAVFEDIEQAAGLLCDGDGNPQTCDILDMDFPIRDYLVPTLIELVVKELLGAAYRPLDSRNDASDDLSDVIAWARRNMKSGFQRQIEE